MHVQIHTKQTISSLWLQAHSHSQTWGPLRPSDFLHAADKQEVTAELQHRSHAVARKMLERLCTSAASQGALLFPPADFQFSPFTCDLPPTGCCHISMSPLLFPTSVATSCSPLTKKKKGRLIQMAKVSRSHDHLPALPLAQQTHPYFVHRTSMVQYPLQYWRFI